MLTLMEKIRDLLIHDTNLLALVPIEAIASSARQHAYPVSIEYELSGTDRGNIGEGKTTTDILFYAHSESGTALCYKIIEALYVLMTPKNLTSRSRGFVVSRVRQTDLRTSPRNEFVSTVRVRFAVHLVEIEPTII